MKQIVVFLMIFFIFMSSAQINVIYKDDYYDETDAIKLSFKDKIVKLCSYSLKENSNIIFYNIQHMMLENKMPDYICSISTRNDTTQIYAIGEYFWNIFEYPGNIIGACHLMTEKGESRNIIISCDDDINSKRVLSEIFKRKGDSINYVRNIKILPDSVYIIKHYTPTGFVSILKNDTIIINKIYY